MLFVPPSMPFVVPDAFAQTPLILILNPLPPTVQAGDPLTFSGKLMTADQQFPVHLATIHIKDDVSFGSDIVMGTVTTNNEDGTFFATWIATPRSDGSSYDFYAVFEGTSDLGYARSQTFSVSVIQATTPTPQFYGTKIVLESLPSTVQEGDTITFSGQLQTADGQYSIPSVETIYIKDDVSFGSDIVMGTVTTSSKDGTFFATWIATPRSDGSSYDFYAVFEGTSDLGYARSQTETVTVTQAAAPAGPTPTALILNQTVQEGDTITFSGRLLTKDQQFFLSGYTIHIKDNISLGTDTPIGTAITSSTDGTFTFTWKAVPRVAHAIGPYQFYAVFEGTPDFGTSKSNFQKLSSSITLDPIASNVAMGTKVIFSGMLKLENGNPAGKTVYIKDEDPFDPDNILAKVTVGPDGRYQASWIVKDVESTDYKDQKNIANFSVPVYAIGLNAFLAIAEKSTVEVYAVFEGDETTKKSDTCVMEDITVANYDGTSVTKQSEQKNCKNNILIISGLDNSASGVLKSQVIGMILSQAGADSDLLTSLVGGGSTGKITQSETRELKDILLSLDPIKEQTSGKSGMSLEEIFNLIDNPSSVIEEKLTEKIEDKLNEKIEGALTTKTVTAIPDWIKNNAGWWAKGQIDDSTFLQGIQYLINRGIIVIPPTVTTGSAGSQEIPAWVKNFAGWWAGGIIDDKTFVSGIQYLIKFGMIKVEPASMDDLGKVTRIVDGDTLLIDQKKIRLSLVNTPERGERGYQEAKDFTSTVCPVGINAKFVEDSRQPVDKYGRSVGLVYCNDMLLNELLLTNGHAEILTYYCDRSEFGSKDWAKAYGC